MNGTAQETAETLVKGIYQRALVSGCARWSGSDLQGKARQYGGRYAESRRALASRMREAGLQVSESLEPIGEGMRKMRVLIVE